MAVSLEGEKCEEKIFMRKEKKNLRKQKSLSLINILSRMPGRERQKPKCYVFFFFDVYCVGNEMRKKEQASYHWKESGTVQEGSVTFGTGHKNVV